MKPAMLITVAFVLLAGGAALGASKQDPNLVGDWSLNGQPYASFKADGTGSLEGEPFRWTADGKVLVLSDLDGSERMPYQIKNGRLLVTSPDGRVELERAEPKSAGRPSPKAGGDQLSQLLLSSAWCSFSYNKVSGASHQSRVQFFANGTWAAGSRGETYSSGAGGSVAGQHDSGAAGRWKVQNGRLFMSNPESTALAPVTMTVKRNSSGSPIITADGTEYSQCR